MKALKIGLVLIVALLVLALGGGLMLSPQFSVTRTATIQAPPEKIYPLIAEPAAWKAWSVWNQRDPAMAIEYSGPASGPGAVWAWKSKSQGDGRMTFTRATPPTQLAYELYFPDFGTTSQGEFLLRPQGGSTQVTWTMNGEMGANPLMRWLGLFMDKLTGPDFDAGLAKLKAIAEKQP